MSNTSPEYTQQELQGWKEYIQARIEYEKPDVPVELYQELGWTMVKLAEASDDVRI